MSLIVRQPSHFHAKLGAIKSPWNIELTLFLGFGVEIKQHVFVAGLQRTRLKPKTLARARKCLGMLLSVSSLVVEPEVADDPMPSFWGAQFYREGSLPFSSGLDTGLANVNPYIVWLSEQETPYNEAHVRDLLFPKENDHG